MSIVQFGEYLPDQPAFANPGLITAKNVIPHAASYRPLAGLNAYSDALTARCQGATALRAPDDVIYNFAGDATKLYKLDGAAGWTDVSGATYTTSSIQTWRFLQFGSNVVAINGSDAPQKYEMGVDIAFSALGGTPPTFSLGATVREFLVVAGISNNLNRLQWCDQNDITDWTTDGSSQAGSIDLPRGGTIMAITGGEYGVIFQESRISRLDYVGLPTVWQLDTVEEDRGCSAPNSVVPYGDRVFYLAQDGFFMFNGQSSVPIGGEKVDKTFLADLDQNYMERVYGTIDPINKIVAWAYPGSGNSSGTPNKIIMFNYELGKWSHAEVTLDFIYESFSESYTLESLSAAFPNLETVPAPLDSRVWMGGNLLLSAFGTDFKLSYFTGNKLAATFVTGDLQLVPGARALVTNTRPLVDVATTVRVGAKEKLPDSVTFSASSSQNTFGENPVTVSGRYHRFEVTVPAAASWTHAQGIEVQFDKQGGY